MKPAYALGCAVMLCSCLAVGAWGESSRPEVKLVPMGKAWAANSVNTTIFRNDPITTVGEYQYAAYYNAEGKVVLASRKLPDGAFTEQVTSLTGNYKDAHNSICLIADGGGYLHVSWDHHGHPLRYVMSKAPVGDGKPVEFTDKLSMTGNLENNVTYPQFFRLANGDLLFFYRDGSSGRGNMMFNVYDHKAKTWSQPHENLISGENQRNAYWQACVDGKGSIHVSWVWRETWDVATNHDILYARSDDGGKTWKKSDGSVYELPIVAKTAEVVSEIPQKSELINQTSMCTDTDGNPIIATYFRKPGTSVPQYFVIAYNGGKWQTAQATNRKTPFSLSGGGSKAIPISRPQVFARTVDGKTSVSIIYRDTERDTRVSAAHCPDISKPAWTITDLTDFPVRFWEPSYDRVRWQRDGVLSLYVQMNGQGDGEKLENVEPQQAYVLDWKP